MSMTEYDERIVEETRQQRGNLQTEEFVGIVERYHSHERPGVARTTIDRYAAALADERGVDFDREAFVAALDDGLTDVDT